MLKDSQSILFTRQRHDAEKAGLHYDYRLVVGDKAHSWATKKEMPEPGKAIILWEQPIHTADYALSEKVEIPTGQYGAGITTLDWVKKGKARFSEGKITVETKDGKFLIKKMPEHYGKGAWMFKRVNGSSETSGNTYLDKMASDLSIATKSHGEESKAIHDYTQRLKDAESPELKKAIEHARSEEKDHAADFKRIMEKVSMFVRQYQHGDTGMTTWITEKQKSPGKRWHPTGNSKYIKRKNQVNNRYLKKLAGLASSAEGVTKSVMETMGRKTFDKVWLAKQISNESSRLSKLKAPWKN